MNLHKYITIAIAYNTATGNKILIAKSTHIISCYCVTLP